MADVRQSRPHLAVAVFMGAVLAFAGCSSEQADSDADTASEVPTGTEPAEEASDDQAGKPIATAVVELGEWYIDTLTEYQPGTVAFSVTNVGNNPHSFAVSRGDSYEDLPQLANGAVDLEAIAFDYLGASENLGTGDSATIEFDLLPGNYVFFCPIEFGPNSHAGAGQVLSVSVG